MNGLLTSWHEVTAIVLLITVINAGFVWAVKWLISSVLRDCSVKIIDLHKTSEALKDDLFALKERLPREYIRREDWILGFGKIEQKIDAIWTYILERKKEA